ncbi:MAG: carbamate kinase [Proteobacteria bacterium]|nr:carbamate kinase [Pseudomonadota bacterium]
MRIVVALGGNALLVRGEPLEAGVQAANVGRAARALAGLAGDHEIVLTHGNGPQVGLLLLQAEAYREVSPYPLDLIGAESEGMIGYLIERELVNALPGRNVATLLTQVVVAPDDPAFAAPTKPIGPVYPASEAERLHRERGWAVAPDGTYVRRVVPSPQPLRILELATIRLLVEAGVIVICAGGGGIPVVLTPEGAVRGIEAVIDKDASAALLAVGLEADALLMLTDVDAVYLGWGTPEARPLRRTSPRAFAHHAFAPGSMGPKVEAACRFVAETGGLAGIGALRDAARILTGEAGTLVAPD